MSRPKLSDFSHAQRDRLAFIELRLWFVGEFQRQDLVSRFGIQSAAATRDMSLYKELASDNIDYDTRSKRYVLAPGFVPVFDYPAARVLTWLTQGFGDGEPAPLRSWVACETPSGITQPSLATLAAVTRAIHHKAALRIAYYSVSSGRSIRDIVPFALIDTGLRWHVRAFDRKSKEFRDFVITRIEAPEVLVYDTVQDHERPEQDIQWTRIVELELVPHPDRPYPEITLMDYGMTNGVLKLRTRAATAGYMLRKWSVDCSADHRLDGPEYRLWLKDHLTLYGVGNAVLAPGYLSPMSL